MKNNKIMEFNFTKEYLDKIEDLQFKTSIDTNAQLLKYGDDNMDDKIKDVIIKRSFEGQIQFDSREFQKLIDSLYLVCESRRDVQFVHEQIRDIVDGTAIELTEKFKKV